jgi:methylenetetrahydrofolate dehydrogenase (NADP+) / methenyltetrahydrofolate cyclohydrolase
VLVLDGKSVALKVKNRLSQEIENLKKSGQVRAPGLAVVIVGEDPASQVYVNNKIKACAEVGIRSFHHVLPAHTSEAAVIQLVEKLNQDPLVDGILVQLPLPKSINSDNVIAKIAQSKDADGLTYANLGALFAGHPVVKPCTPAGVIEILKHFKIEIAGRSAVVVGRSQIVGRPMAALLIDENATVTVAHSKTQNLEEITRQADIVVVAAGKPRMLGREAFKKGAIVIDVGIHRLPTGLCGDVRYEELEGHAQAATPVPGGVGAMTIAMLMENTFQLAKRHLART